MSKLDLYGLNFENATKHEQASKAFELKGPNRIPRFCLAAQIDIEKPPICGYYNPKIFITTSTGKASICHGDWVIISAADTAIWVIDDAIFRVIYEPVVLDRENVIAE